MQSLLPESHNLVLHRFELIKIAQGEIANPGPSGLLGSNPSSGVFFFFAQAFAKSLLSEIFI